MTRAECISADADHTRCDTSRVCRVSLSTNGLSYGLMQNVKEKKCQSFLLSSVLLK